MVSFRWALGTMALLGLGWGGQGEAHAQQFQDFTVPQTAGLSPYLNLFRGGGPNAALNYYGLIRPQIQDQSNILQLQQQQLLLQRQLNQRVQVGTGGGRATPHVPGYMTHEKYFLQGGNLAAGTGKTSKSLSDRRVNTGPTQTPARTGINQFGTNPVGTNQFGTNQTRTVFPANNLSPPFTQPFNPLYTPSFAPFNPYRGF